MTRFYLPCTRESGRDGTGHDGRLHLVWADWEGNGDAIRCTMQMASHRSSDPQAGPVRTRGRAWSRLVSLFALIPSCPAPPSGVFGF